MSQQDTADERIINLEPIGGGRVSQQEFTQAVETVFGAVRSLGKDSPATTTNPPPEQTEPDPPGFDINWAKIRRYGLYAGGTVTAIYLIGKALE